VKLHAFLALLTTSMALGLAASMAPLTVLKSMQTGFGDALGFIAVVVALGAMLGRLLEHSGGGSALAEWMLARTGRRYAVWAVFAASFLIGLPIFFEVGFMILVPLAYALARESKRSLLYFGLPMAAALTVTHAIVPPHPAPAAAAQLLGADLGKAILYGAALSIPMALSGGLVYGLWIARRMFIAVPERPSSVPPPTTERPSVGLVVLLLTLPVMLILVASTAGRLPFSLQSPSRFLGHPFTALTVTTLLAMYFLGARRGLDREKLLKLTTDALMPIGTLLAIMGAGGAFKQVIVDSGVGPQAGQLLAEMNVSPLILAYVVAAGLRIAQGSATVAIITAGGIVAPLVAGRAGYSPEMTLLALCAGGTILSHVNDAGFWLVKECFGMTVAETLRSWTMMKVVTSFVGIILVLGLNAILN
jgi:gluconate transporter